MGWNPQRAWHASGKLSRLSTELFGVVPLGRIGREYSAAVDAVDISYEKAKASRWDPAYEREGVLPDCFVQDAHVGSLETNGSRPRHRFRMLGRQLAYTTRQHIHMLRQCRNPQTPFRISNPPCCDRICGRVQRRKGLGTCVLHASGHFYLFTCTYQAARSYGQAGLRIIYGQM